MQKKVPGAFVLVDDTLEYVLCMCIYEMLRGISLLFKS